MMTPLKCRSFSQPEPLFNCQRHVVLVSPDIHWNTGNIGRTCLGAGATLHLIKPLGFSTDHRSVKRAGLDYWEFVDLNIWDNFHMFLTSAAPQEEEIFLFSKNGSRPHWSLPVQQRMFLIFGSETRGLPASILAAYENSIYYIPFTRHIRSFNLSTAVGIALFESLRAFRPDSGR